MLTQWTAVAVCLALTLVAPGAFYPAVRWAGPRVRLAWYVVIMATLAAAMVVLVPVEHRLTRLMLAIAAAAVLTPLYDLHRAATRYPEGLPPDHPDPRDLGVYHRFILACGASGTFRHLGHGPVRPARENVRDILVGLGMMLVGLLALMEVGWGDVPVVIEYAGKPVAVFLVVDGLWRARIGSVRLSGRRDFGFSRGMWTAATPAEFWRKYNVPVNQFLHEHVFVPVGGRRRPVMGTMVVFLVSGVLHEALFTIALGRVEGYQTAFFLLQGTAVAATMRVRPRTRWARVVGIVLTYAWLLSSGLLFWASADGVIEFWARR